MILVGIDPGLTGGIGIVGHKAEFLSVHDMPVMQRQGAKAYVKNQVNGAALEDLLKTELASYDKNEIMVVMETPVAFPKQHVAVTASAFLTAGIIEGVLTGRHYNLKLVSPADWKKALKLTSTKEQCRAFAIRLYPGASLHRVKDHNRAESLLIAKYGHETYA